MNTNNLFISMSQGNEREQALLVPPAFLFFSRRLWFQQLGVINQEGQGRERVLSQPSAALSVFRIPGLTSWLVLY